MIIHTIQTSDCTPQTIVIGRRTTYDTLQVVFDLSYLAGTYGSGAAVLVVKRSQDTTAYPATIAQDGNTLTWTITEVDTYYVGAGECELMWYVNNGLAKTIIYPVVVMRDILQTAEEPPDAYENWVESLTALGAETQQHALDAAQSAEEAETAQGKAEDAQSAAETALGAAEEAAERAETAIVHAPIIQGGYWYIWDNGQYINTNVRAEGEKGDKGDTGEKGDTGNGIASITKTGTAGLVDTYTVTYTDGTTTTFTVTNGAKGDKGDTGATGNGIQSITKTGTSGNVDTYTITYTNGQTTTFTVTNGAVTSVAGKTGAVALDAGDIGYDPTATYTSGTVGNELSALTRQLNDKLDAPATAGTAGQVLSLDSQLNPVWSTPSGGGGDVSNCAPIIINTASGDIATFTDGADNMPIRKIVATIEPVQEGTGDPSPDNVRPISGWTGANIYCLHGNIFNAAADAAQPASNDQILADAYSIGIHYSLVVAPRVGVTNFVKTERGCSYTTNNNSFGVGYCVKVRAGQKLSVSANMVNGKLTVVFCNADFSQKTVLQNPTEFTVPSGCERVVLVLQAITANTTASFDDVMIYDGDAPSQYSQYEPIRTLSINWQSEAGTIYGGAVTLNEDGSADVVSDVATATITGSMTVRSVAQTKKGFAIRYSAPSGCIVEDVNRAVRCNCFQHVDSSLAQTLDANTCTVYNPSSPVFVFAIPLDATSDYTKEGAQAYVASLSTPIVYTYKTTNAQNYHFDNIGQLFTYFGTNNVWIDTGAITECDYPADTKLYIDGKIAEIQATILENIGG